MEFRFSFQLGYLVFSTFVLTQPWFHSDSIFFPRKPCSAFWKLSAGRSFCPSARRVSIKQLVLSFTHLSWSTPMKALSLRILLPIAALLCFSGLNLAHAKAQCFHRSAPRQMGKGKD